MWPRPEETDTAVAEEPNAMTIVDFSPSFITEAAVTPPTRTCYYHDWQDVTAAQVVSFLTHEAVHHLFDLRRHSRAREVSHAR
jgi:hypothetical protein